MTRAMVILATTFIAAVGGTATAQAYDHESTGVLVYSGDGWYPAQIVEIRGPHYLVHYDNTGYESDEWVTASRIQGLGYAPLVAYDPIVRVYWGNRWYDGTVFDVRAGRYHVRYRGIDEWVYPSRLHMHARGHAWRGWGRVHTGGGYHYGRTGYRNSYVGARHDWGKGRHDDGNHGGRNDGHRDGGHRNGGRHNGR